LVKKGIAMENIEKTLKLVSEILAESERYPWKTAKYLSMMLRKKGCYIEPKTLEKALIDHSRLPNRKVRYSFFPARKTLDLLWGHVRVVNDFDHLPDPALEQHVGEFEPCHVPKNATWCFLSHNFLDLQVVLKIRDELLARAYGVWLAEAEILLGEMITHSVQKGLDLSDRFIVYITRNSLGSRWVLKESLVAIKHWHIPPTVIVDGNDPQLMALFQDWLDAKWDKLPGNRIDALLCDSSKEQAATYLPDLLVAGLNSVPPQNRVVVIYPVPSQPISPGFRKLEEVFPKMNYVE